MVLITLCVCVQVLAVRRLDHDYALALLLAAPPSTAVQSLKAIRTRSISSYSRVIVSLCINLNKSWVYIIKPPRYNFSCSSKVS